MEPLASDPFFARVILYMGLSPTAERLAFFAEWARHENTGARFNPLATTQPGGEFEADPYWNTFGDAHKFHVRNYKDGDAGVHATVATLQNGYYPAILQTLIAEEVQPETARQVRTWGTTSFAQLLDNGWTPFYRTASIGDEETYRVLDSTGLLEWFEAGNIRIKPAIAALQDNLARLEGDLAALKAAIGAASAAPLS